MKCPHCFHISETALLRCAECGETYDRDTLEQFQYVEYLLKWLETREQVIGAAITQKLRTEVLVDWNRLRDVLLPTLEPEPAPVPVPPALEISAPQLDPALAAIIRLDGVRTCLREWADVKIITLDTYALLHDHLTEQIERVYPTDTDPPLDFQNLPPVERNDLLRYALDSLEEWEHDLLVSETHAALLREYLEDQLVTVGEVVKPMEPAPFVGDLARETAFLLGVRGLLWEWQRANILDLSTFDRIYFLLTQQASKIHPEEGGIKISLPEVAKKELLEFTLESLLEQWHEKAMLSNEQFFYLRKFLTAQLSQAAPATITPLPVPAITPEPVPVPTQSQEIALPAELASPPIAVPPVTLTPPAPPKPREPLIQWDKLWGKVVEAAVSGLLLRWLRYLGAFLFVISIAIVVINFWESIPALGQLAIIFFIPTAFYTGGGYVRNRLQVRQTGAVLMGIGQVLLALAFAAIYRSVGAKIPFEWYWLGTSLICTTLYVFTSWRLVREEFFGYISLAGIGSTMMALAWLLTQTIAWPLTALVGINILIIESAYRLPRASEDWREIGKAGQRFPLIVVPIVLGLLLFVPESDADVARVFSFALATTTAGMLAWRFTRPVYTHLTVWGSVLTAGITLWAFNVPLEWLGTVAAVLSPAYIFSHQGLQKRLEEAFPRRGFHLLPFQLAGFGLLALSIVWGLLTTPFEFWSGVITLTLASVILGGYAPWLRQPLFVLASGGLFLVPFSLAVWRWLEDVFQRSDWLTASWVGLAFVYLGIAALLRQKPRYMRWLTLLAQSLLPLAIVVMGFFSLIRETTFTIPPLVSLGVVIGVYLLTAILHDSRMHPALSEWVNWLPDNLRTAIFLYPISILIPIWVSVAWRGSVLIPAWLGAALAGVTGAYIGIGQLLSRRQIAYRFPFHLTAYFVGIISIFVAIPNKPALITTLYLNTAALAVFAAIYKRPHESFLASILFLWPFQLSLESSQLTLHAHSLAYILLAGLGYVPLGLWLRRKTEVDHHLPILVTGYGISVFAVVISTLAPLNPTALNVPWIGAVVPLLAAGLYVYSAYILRPEFSWAAVVVFPLGFSQALVWFRIQPAYHAVAWVLLSIGYLVLCHTLISRSATSKTGASHSWLYAFRWPLNIGAWVLVGLGLVLTAIPTLDALLLGMTQLKSPATLLPIMIAQWVAVGFVILSAVLYRSRWPLFLQPWLATLPVTLLFIGYGEAMFGQAMTSAQFGIVWVVLGFVHVGIAAGVERFSESASQQITNQQSPNRPMSQMHGVYLGGYGMGTLAVEWALRDQVSFLWAFGLWIGMIVGSALLAHLEQHHAWADLLRLVFGEKVSALRAVIRDAFIWVAAVSFPVWLVVLLNYLRVADGFQWLGFAFSGLAFLGLGAWLGRIERSYAWPMKLAAHFYTALGLLISVPFTFTLLVGGYQESGRLTALSFILLQWTAVVTYVSSARLQRSTILGYFFPYVAAVLSFFPYTVGWVVFGADIFGRALSQAEFGVAWMGLAIILLGLATNQDQSRTGGESKSREWGKLFAHGPYLVGYLLAFFAQVWVIGATRMQAQPAFLWTMGLWIAVMAGSATWTHFGLHRTWVDLVNLILGDKRDSGHKVVEGLFLWLAAWPFPVWMTALLWQLGVEISFGYLGYVGSALALLGLAVWLRKVERTYSWPLISAGQFFTLLALGQTLEVSALVLSGRKAIPGGYILFEGFTPGGKFSMLGNLLVQTAAFLYYGLSSWFFQNKKWVGRLFSYAAAGLVFIPYTLAWMLYRFDGYSLQLAYAWIGLAAGFLGVGYGLDWGERVRTSKSAIQQITQSPNRRMGFGHGPYVIGYLVLGLAFAQSWADRWVNIVAWAGVIILTGLSHMAVHYERHDSFLDFLNLFWRRGETIARRAVRTGFLFIAAYGFPVWLAQVLAYNDVQLAWRGLALALVAPLYIAFGLAVRRVREEYTWPLFTAGYLLTAVGAMISFDDPLLAMYVLSLNAAVYAASAYIFQQAGWLYLSTVLAPIIGLMALDYNLDALPANWVAGKFMVLAFMYFGAGRWFDRTRTSEPSKDTGGTGSISPFALPFYAPGYLLSAVALAVSSVDRPLAVVVYLSGVVLYALSAWAFREAIFLYPAVWLAAVPYYLGMTFTRLLPAWYGIGWLPLIVAVIGVGRVFFHKRPLALTHPAMPFYILAYALSLSMMFIARGDMTTLTVAFGAAGGLYLCSAGLFRRAWWLYPGLLAGHLSLITYFAIDPSGAPVRFITLAFVPVTWGMGLIGGMLRRRGNLDWGMPFLTFAALDVVGWGVLSLFGWETGIIVATSHALLLSVVAMMWVSTPLVWGSLGFLALAMWLRLAWMGLELPVFAATVAGIGFGLYLTGRMVETLGARIRSVDGTLPGWGQGVMLWGVPLTWIGVGINSLGAVIPLGFILSHTTQAAAGLAFAGAMYLAVAYRSRYYRLGYLAVAMLELAFVLILVQQDIRQPQWYAIPAGLYFTGIGVFERRRGRLRFAQLVESFGLSVLLVTSFIQSLSLETGFWYFLLLLVEGLAVIGWAAQQRRKLPFLLGVGASAANAMGQVVVVFLGGSTLIRWVIFGGVGLLLLLAAVYAERWLIPRTQELRERLENWQ